MFGSGGNVHVFQDKHHSGPGFDFWSHFFTNDFSVAGNKLACRGLMFDLTYAPDLWSTIISICNDCAEHLGIENRLITAGFAWEFSLNLYTNQ